MSIGIKRRFATLLAGILLVTAAYIGYIVMTSARSTGYARVSVASACIERSITASAEQPGAGQDQTLYISCGGFLE